MGLRSRFLSCINSFKIHIEYQLEIRKWKQTKIQPIWDLGELFNYPLTQIPVSARAHSIIPVDEGNRNIRNLTIHGAERCELIHAPQRPIWQWHDEGTSSLSSSINPFLDARQQHEREDEGNASEAVAVDRAEAPVHCETEEDITIGKAPVDNDVKTR